MVAGVMRCWRAALVAAALWTAVGPVAAQASPDELARKHFESGVAYLQESDYPNALRAFEKSYELSKRPEIFLNLATVHERSGDLRAAVAVLQRYLTDAPQGQYVETVKLRIANLEKRIAEGQTGPQPAPASEPSEVVPRPPPAPSPPPPVAPPPPAPAEQPDRVPAYVAFGAGGLFAAGAIVTGILAQGEYDDAEQSCAPRCSDDQISSAKTLAVTSTILTGLAVVGVGVGTFLYFSRTPSERVARSRRWDVRIDVGASRAGGSAVWSF